MKRPFFRFYDIILIVALLVACGAFVLMPKSKGNEVQIKVDGEVMATLPLDTDTKYSVKGVTVRVRNGKAWIEKSDCADKTCVNTGVLENEGDTAVCLPNKVAVTVMGERETDGVTW